MKILVDVNIFEDIYRQRTGWEASLAVVSHVRTGKITGYVSALTPPILYFLRRRGKNALEFFHVFWNLPHNQMRDYLRSLV